MNVIEFVRTKLLEFPKISEICNTIHVDFTDDAEENYGLSSNGDTLLTEDILGNQKRVHNFILFAVYQSVNDFDRLTNSGVLYELQLWLEKQANDQEVTVTIGNETKAGYIETFNIGNGMLFQIPNENHIDLVRYQLQIAAHYALKE